MSTFHLIPSPNHLPCLSMSRIPHPTPRSPHTPPCCKSPRCSRPHPHTAETTRKRKDRLMYACWQLAVGCWLLLAVSFRSWQFRRRPGAAFSILRHPPISSRRTDSPPPLPGGDKYTYLSACSVRTGPGLPFIFIFICYFVFQTMGIGGAATRGYEPTTSKPGISTYPGLTETGGKGKQCKTKQKYSLSCPVMSCHARHVMS